MKNSTKLIAITSTLTAVATTTILLSKKIYCSLQKTNIEESEELEEPVKIIFAKDYEDSTKLNGIIILNENLTNLEITSDCEINIKPIKSNIYHISLDISNDDFIPNIFIKADEIDLIEKAVKS